LRRSWKIEMVENSRFMTEARRKELDRGKQMQRSKEELTSMLVGKNEKRKFSLFPHPRHRRNVSRCRCDPAACS